MSTFACDTCFDTEVIDHAGAEVPCPDCQFVEIKLTGLSHGMGGYAVNYTTAVAQTGSTITFRAATKGAIIADVARVRSKQVAAARRAGLPSRNTTSSWAIAIENRLRRAVAS